MRGRRARPPGWKGRNEIATRLATLLRIAVRCRLLPPLRELARELEVHPRTVKRDLAALEAARVVLPVSTADGAVIEWRYVDHSGVAVGLRWKTEPPR